MSEQVEQQSSPAVIEGPELSAIFQYAVKYATELLRDRDGLEQEIQTERSLTLRHRDSSGQTHELMITERPGVKVNGTLKRQIRLAILSQDGKDSSDTIKILEGQLHHGTSSEKGTVDETIRPVSSAEWHADFTPIAADIGWRMAEAWVKAMYPDDVELIPAGQAPDFVTNDASAAATP